MKISLLFILLNLALLSVVSHSASVSSFWRNADTVALGSRQIFVSYFGRMQSHSKAETSTTYTEADVQKVLAKMQSKFVLKSTSPQASAVKYKATLIEELSGVSTAMVYGMSPYWTFGVHLPIEKREYRLNEEYSFDEKLMKLNASSQSLQKEVKVGLKQQQEESRAHQNYKKLRSRYSEYQINDLELLSKYKWYESSKYKWFFKNLVRVPLNNSYDPNEFLMTYGDDGQWDLGMGLSVDYTLNSFSHLWMGFEYTIQFSDQIKLRSYDKLKETSVLERGVSRDLGDFTAAYVGGAVSFKSSWRVEFNYEMLQKSEDKIASKFKGGLIKNSSWATQKVNLAIIKSLIIVEKYGISPGNLLAGLEIQSDIDNQGSDQNKSAHLNLSMIY